MTAALCSYCRQRPATVPYPARDSTSKVCARCREYIIDAAERVRLTEERMDKRDRDRERCR